MGLKPGLAVPDIADGHVERFGGEFGAAQLVDGKNRVDKDAVGFVVEPEQILVKDGAGSGSGNGEARLGEFHAADETIEQGFPAAATELEHVIRRVFIHEGVPFASQKHEKADIDTEPPDFPQIAVRELAIRFVKEPDAVVLDKNGRVIGVFDGAKDRDGYAVAEKFGLARDEFVDIREAQPFEIVAKLRAGELADENGYV